MHAVYIGPVTGQKGDKYMDNFLVVKSAVLRLKWTFLSPLAILRTRKLKGSATIKIPVLKNRYF